MKTERELLQWFKKTDPKTHYQGIELGNGQGVPDVHYGTERRCGWLELKLCALKKLTPDSYIKLKHPARPNQVAWTTKRLSTSNDWVEIAIGFPTFVAFVNGRHMKNLMNTNKMTVNSMMAGSRAFVEYTDASGLWIAMQGSLYQANHNILKTLGFEQ